MIDEADRLRTRVRELEAELLALQAPWLVGAPTVEEARALQMIVVGRYPVLTSRWNEEDDKAFRCALIWALSSPHRQAGPKSEIFRGALV